MLQTWAPGKSWLLFYFIYIFYAETMKLELYGFAVLGLCIFFFLLVLTNQYFYVLFHLDDKDTPANNKQAKWAIGFFFFLSFY